MQGAAVHAAGAGAQAARGERGPGGTVESEPAVEPVAHDEPLFMVERDQRGGDGESEAFHQDADLRELAIVVDGRLEAIGGIVGQAGGHGGNSFGGLRAGGRPAGHTHVGTIGASTAGGRRAGSAAGRPRRARPPGSEAGAGGCRFGLAPAHQGGAVSKAMGLTSATTSTSSRASFSKARQSATSASLS